jgi:cadmium resistance protein CadD (predicted permease)
MNWFVSALITGALAFSATNIDDIVFLTIFFSLASHRWQVVIGQYLGFTAPVLVRSVKKTLIRLLFGSGAEQDHAM